MDWNLLNVHCYEISMAPGRILTTCVEVNKGRNMNRLLVEVEEGMEEEIEKYVNVRQISREWERSIES